MLRLKSARACFGTKTDGNRGDIFSLGFFSLSSGIDSAATLVRIIRRRSRRPKLGLWLRGLLVAAVGGFALGSFGVLASGPGGGSVDSGLVIKSIAMLEFEVVDGAVFGRRCSAGSELNGRGERRRCGTTSSGRIGDGDGDSKAGLDFLLPSSVLLPRLLVRRRLLLRRRKRPNIPGSSSGGDIGALSQYQAEITLPKLPS